MMMKPSVVRDRRRHLRIASERPVQVRCGTTGRYIAGHTVNVSDGGCLLRLDGPVGVTAGQSVTVGIAPRRLRTCFMHDDMQAGTVVRRLAHDGTQHVAVAFENARVLAVAG